MFVVDHAEASAARNMKTPVRAARSRSGRTAGRPGPASQELFSEERDSPVHPIRQSLTGGCPRRNELIERGTLKAACDCGFCRKQTGKLASD